MPYIKKKSLFAQHKLLKQLNVQYSSQSVREALNIFPTKKTVCFVTLIDIF